MVKRGLGVVCPRNERVAVLVLEAHAVGELGKDLHVGPRLAGRLDRLVREVHAAVHVGAASRLFSPLRSGEDDIGECGRLVGEDVLRDDEKILAREVAADAGKFGQGNRGAAPR